MWSWVLAVIGVTGIFFVGRKTIWGWHILLINETLWITYAVITKQYGFIFSALAYGVVYVKSYLLWRREDEKDPVSTPLQRRAVRESIIKDIEALPIEPGLTNALGMKMMAIKAAKGE
jgi:nicotinamide riboside transporter PnuC